MTGQRRELRKELRRRTRQGGSPDEVREEIRNLSGQLKELRKEIALCDGIALRSERMKENLKQLLTEQAVERRERDFSGRREHRHDLKR